MRWPSHGCFKLLAWLTALSGLIYQTYFICNEYFSYAFNTEIVITIPAKFELPTVIVKFTVDNKRFQKPLLRNIVQAIPKNVTCTDHKERPFDVNRTVSVSSVAFSCGGHREIDTNSVAPLKLMSVRVKQFPNKSISRLGYVNVDRQFVIHPVESTLFTTQGFKRGAHTIRLDYISITMLHKPYTNCFDYATHFGAKDSRDCVDNCVSRLLLRKNLWDNTHLANEVIAMKEELEIVTSRMKESHGRYKEVFGNCTNKCRNGDPCSMEFFATEVTRSETGGDDLSLMLKTSTHPYTYSTYTPALSLTDFVVYVLSTFSFWLGIAPLTLMFKVGARVYRKRDHRCKCGRLQRQLAEQKTIIAKHETVMQLHSNKLDQLSAQLRQ